MKFGKKSEITSKKIDSEPVYTERSTRIFTIIKYQKKFLNVFFHQYF